MPRAIHTLQDVRLGPHKLYAVCSNSACRQSKKVDIDRLILRVDARTPLLPQRGQPHFSEGMRCPSCRRRGMYLWVDPAEVKREILKRTVSEKQPNFRIIDHGPSPHTGHDTIAMADNLMVGRGAYVAAALFYPGRRITLTQGAYVVQDSVRDGAPTPMNAERYTEMRQAEAGMSNRTIPPLKAS